MKDKTDISSFLEKKASSSTGTQPLQSAQEAIPFLEVSTNTGQKKQSYPLTEPIINIGRDPINEIVIKDPIVANFHAQIELTNNQCFIVHPHPAREKTLNGLWYQGMLVRGDQPFRRQLVHGDIFRIGSEYGTLVTFVYDDGSGTSKGMLPEIPPIQLTKDRLAIGRVPDNHVVLNHPQVSAHHALLEKVESGYRIVDNNSTNHVYVNGQIVTSQVLRTNDEIRIGPYRFTYTGTELKQSDDSANIRIDALHLKRFGDRQRILLNDISLTIPPRKFVALVGGSGAGKSTLMNALNGLRPAQEGTVLYNGVDYYRNLAAFNTQLGYVPQADIVHRELTVKRALYYTARLRLPSNLTKEQVQWRINEVLEDMEITDQRNLTVSMLSNSQCKRVSIALELLTNPSVLFLDDPTSGLNPSSERKMMALIRRLADRGHTVILVTNATNNINACDYVCFLAQGGHLAYFGPPNRAKEFFGVSDFAEIYSELEQLDTPEQAVARFRASSDYQQYVEGPLNERSAQQLPTKTTASTSEKNRQQIRQGQGWRQFLLLSTRNLELLKNDTGNLLTLLLQAPVIAILMVLLARFQMGTGIFNNENVVQCQTRAVDSNGKLEVVMPQANQQQTIACKDVQVFLKDAQNNKNGQDARQAQQNKAVQDFIKKKGSQDQALQDFLSPGFGANARTVLFLMAFSSVLFGCVNGAREIVKEDATYRHERSVNLGIMPYMLSKVVVLGIFCVFQSAVLTFVIELGEPLQQGIFLSPILETYITLTLTTLAGLMTGLTISAIASNNDRALTFLPVVLLPQVIFAGVIIPFRDWRLQILGMLFPTRWAMTALGSSIGLHSNILGNDHLFGDNESYHGTLFSIYSQTDAMHHLVLCWLALGAINIALMIVIATFLKRKDARS
jgi:ABC transport system ATP-binding/permease protein